MEKALGERMTSRKKIYLEALAIWLVYSVVSKFIFIKSMALSSIVYAYSLPFLFGASSGILFLYIFSRDRVIKYAHAIEKREMGREQKLLQVFKHLGKISITFLIGTIGGPVLAALTIRLLLPNFKYKYFLVILANVPSTLFWMGVARGAISLWI